MIKKTKKNTTKRKRVMVPYVEPKEEDAQLKVFNKKKKIGLLFGQLSVLIVSFRITTRH
jgi:hypothetical protein